MTKTNRVAREQITNYYLHEKYLKTVLLTILAWFPVVKIEPKRRTVPWEYQFSFDIAVGEVSADKHTNVIQQIYSNYWCLLTDLLEAVKFVLVLITVLDVQAQIRKDCARICGERGL